MILVRCNRCQREYPHYDSGLFKVVIMKRLNGGEIVMGEGTSALLSCENDLCEACVEKMEMEFKLTRYVKERK